MKRTFVSIALAVLLVGTLVPSAAASTTKAPVADVAVRLTWIGLGTPRVVNGGQCRLRGQCRRIVVRAARPGCTSNSGWGTSSIPRRHSAARVTGSP